jgi:hypothetical protein
VGIAVVGAVFMSPVAEVVVPAAAPVPVVVPLPAGGVVPGPASGAFVPLVTAAPAFVPASCANAGSVAVHMPSNSTQQPL